jgi:hypothetical protein
MRRLLAALAALFGLASSASAEPPPPFADVEACRQYLVDNPTGPLAEQAFRCVVEAELPGAEPPFGQTPEIDIY